jgi:hypothetical protein
MADAAIGIARRRVGATMLAALALCAATLGCGPHAPRPDPGAGAALGTELATFDGLPGNVGKPDEPPDGDEASAGTAGDRTRGVAITVLGAGVSFAAVALPFLLF